VRSLAGLGGVVLLACALILAAAASTVEHLDVETLTATLELRWAQAFGDGPWRYLPILAATALGLAVVTSGAESATRGRAPARREPKPIEHARPSEALEEIRARIAACVGETTDVVAAWDELLRGAVHLRASDVHVSPSADGVQVTYRVDGDLLDIASFAPDVQAPLTARLKILASLDTTMRATPQDGRLVTTVDGSSVEARVSTLPTESGERIVLRILRGGRAVPDVAALGFSPSVESGLLELLGRAQGLLFVTGPVGSGKTTTLYAALQHIARSRKKTTSLVTLEDPIELELTFATQTQINTRAKMTFASTLRSVLRQDPNVLMVGEIRDQETAEIAMQAGLTGHLILTTVHGHGAAGPFARLIDMGVEPFLLASATLGCLSQRLVRALCPACRRLEKADRATIQRFAKEGLVLSPTEEFYAPLGCDRCDGQGYAGRLPIAELLVVGDPLREALQERRPTGELSKLAEQQGMTTIFADGLRRAKYGETSLAEVIRVAG
jgi:general secretion pathway protein E